MKELVKKMEQQRQRRQNRRTNGKACLKRDSDVTEETDQYVKRPVAVVRKQRGDQILESASTTAAVDAGNVKVRGFCCCF